MSDNLLKEEILRIDQLMNYNRSKTLFEQIPPSVMDRRLGITRKNARATNMTVADYESKVYGAEGADAFIDVVTDPHVFLPALAIVLSIASAGTASPLAAALLAGGSLGLEAIDASLYWKEGEYASAGITALFALFPAAQLAKALGVKILGEVTEAEIKTISNKLKNKLDLTAKEAKVVNAIAENQTKINRMIYMRSAKVLTAELLGKLSGLGLIRALLKMAKLGIISWKMTWRFTGIVGGLYSVGQLGAFLGDETALALGYEVPTEAEKNRDAFTEMLIENAETPKFKNTVRGSMYAYTYTSDEQKQKEVTFKLNELKEWMENYEKQN